MLVNVIQKSFGFLIQKLNILGGYFKKKKLL